jgi:hypothetical protein
MLKRATERGAGPWRITFITNWVAATVFAPWWLAPHLPFTWSNLTHAVICGITFFVGQIFTFLALSRGDVSGGHARTGNEGYFRRNLWDRVGWGKTGPRDVGRGIPHGRRDGASSEGAAEVTRIILQGACSTDSAPRLRLR